MKKIIFLFAFTVLGFLASNAQNGVTKPATTQSKATPTEKVVPTKAEVKEDKKDDKKENCSSEEKKKCAKKSKGCCAHKAAVKN